MASDSFETQEEAFPAEVGIDEKAEKLLEESDGNEDPDSGN
jgi:hypothetical protein